MMADWYVDHGCTLYPTAYMSATTLLTQLPQEGDGRASGTGAAPASAVATMDFTGVTAAATATISIMGATLTCVASGATTTQFNAGSGATLAANLATAINAAVSTPTATDGSIVAAYLKGLVWAQASGAVLTVKTRIASARLNYIAGVQPLCRIVPGVTAWTAPPAASEFSGGVSGPWAYVWNTAALTAGISSTVSAIGTYGGFVNTMMGMPAPGDTVNIRTARTNIGIIVSFGVSNAVIYFRTVGSLAAYVNFVWDDGTVWNDGTSSGVFQFRQDGASNASIQPSGYVRWLGKIFSGPALVRDGGVPNLKFSHTLTNNAGYASTLRLGGAYGAGHFVLQTAEFYDSGAGLNTFGGWNLAPNTYIDPHRPIKFINVKYGTQRAAQAMFTGSNSFNQVYDLEDCLFDFGLGATYTSAIANASSVIMGGVIRLIRPKFTGGNSGHHSLLAIAPTTSKDLHFIIEDPVSMGDFQPGDSAASVCGKVSGNASPQMGMGEMAICQVLQSPTQFLLDTPRRIIEVRGDAFPNTGISKLQDGTTTYAIRFSTVPTGIGANLVTRFSPQRCIKQQNRNTLGAGARTLTQHILLDSNWGGSAYTPTDDYWWIEGTYIDPTGVVVPFTTKGTGTALDADTQAWSSLTYTPFGGASRSYSRWKMTASLANVAADSIVSAFVMCATQPSSLAEWCLVDPLFELA